MTEQMVVQDFLNAALTDHEKDVQERMQLDRERRIRNGKAIRNTLPYNAFPALGIDPNEVITPEHTTEVYVHGEVEVDGEKMEVQMNCDDGLSSFPVVVFTVLATRSETTLKSGPEYFEANVNKIGRALIRAKDNLRVMREDQRTRARNVVLSLIPQDGRIPISKANENLSRLREEVFKDERLTREDKDKLYAKLDEEGKRATEIFTKRQSAAKRIMKLASLYVKEIETHESMCLDWANFNTDRIWESWEARLVEYTRVAGNINLSRFGDDEDDFYDSPALELTAEAVLLKEKDERGWDQEVSAHGDITPVEITSVVKTSPLYFYESTIQKPLRFHRTYRASSALGDYWVNVPPHMAAEPTPAPDPPTPWRHIVDQKDLDLLPTDIADHVSSADGSRILEALRNVLQPWL